MLQNVNNYLQTNVKLSRNSLTSRTQPPLTSHPTPTQLSLWRFRKKFVPLPTMNKTHFIGGHTFLHVPYLLFHFYIQSSWEK